MANAKAAWLTQTPLVPTGGSLDEAVAFYTNQLGFVVEWRGGNMAGICRDQVRFNLVENSTQAWLDNSSISIGVTNLDAIWAEYKDVPVRMTPPEMKFWGRREMHMIVPSGVCLQFYELAG